MREFVIVYPNRDYGKLMWRDVEEKPYVSVIKDPIISQNRLINLLFRIHFSFRINSIVNLPLKQIWEGRYSLSAFSFKNDREYILIFTDAALGNYTVEFLNEIKSKGNIKLVLLCINSFNRMKIIIENMIACFDAVYTYDQGEARDLEFSYYPTIYSRLKLDAPAEKPIDCFFVGVAKDRLNKIIDAYDELTASGYKCEFYISGVKPKDIIRREGVVYNKWLDYMTVLQKVIHSKSILEIMDQNNAGITLRTLEAICYNKLLITNNKKVVLNDFYNSSFIYLYSEKINLPADFFDSKKIIDYKYDNRYSPTFFLDELSKNL